MILNKNDKIRVDSEQAKFLLEESLAEKKASLGELMKVSFSNKLRNTEVLVPLHVRKTELPTMR